MAFTVLPLDVPQAVAAALTAAVSAGPEEPYMRLRVIPVVAPLRATLGDLAALEADAIVPTVAPTRDIASAVPNAVTLKIFRFFIEFFPFFH
jgi:hypothetical protein